MTIHDIIAIDPGLNTGVAIAQLDPRTPHSEPPYPDTVTHPAFHHHYLTVARTLTVAYDDMPTTLDLVLRGIAANPGGPDRQLHVVIEHFQITRTAMMENATWSSEVKGMVIALTKLLVPTARIDATQKPADMKPLVHTPKVLQQLGLRKRGMTTHEADALGHAILYAARASNRQVKL